MENNVEFDNEFLKKLGISLEEFDAGKAAIARGAYTAALDAKEAMSMQCSELHAALLMLRRSRKRWVRFGITVTIAFEILGAVVLIRGLK